MTAVQADVRDAFATRACVMAPIAGPEGNPLWLHRRDDGTAG
ncbi:MAG TPA: hypothetical protein VNK05_03665 [Chloroflexota bacterium]|nr:hypothetical protein [Chloroflexota bacterium]